MRGTSSALGIERALHMLAPWLARRPIYGPVKMARLKRENAVSDAQIGDIGNLAPDRIIKLLMPSMDI